MRENLRTILHKINPSHPRKSSTKVTKYQNLVLEVTIQGLQTSQYTNSKIDSILLLTLDLNELW